MGIVEDIENAIGFVEATAEQVAARLLTLGDFGTAGPDPHPDIEPEHADHPKFVDGWWSEATRMPANPRRVGGLINAVVVVDHTTDMHRADAKALIKKWLEEPGDGAGAHFLVLPAPGADGVGVIQFAPIMRNGNHVGGKPPPNGHGWFLDPARPGVNIHPNTSAIGIEFMCAGGQVRLLNGVWRFYEDGVVHGPAIPEADIWKDPIRPGRGVELLTPYQQRIRAELHADLDATLAPMPAGYRAISTGEAVAAWATLKTQRFLGHYNLDPTNRADPWRPNYGPLLP